MERKEMDGRLMSPGHLKILLGHIWCSKLRFILVLIYGEWHEERPRPEPD